MTFRFDADARRKADMATKVVRGWDYERLQDEGSVASLARSSGLSETEAEKVILLERKRRAR